MTELILTVLAFSVLVGVVVALAEAIQGTIEAVDRRSRSIVVQGIVLHVTEATGFDDSLCGFENLRVGQRVEVDFTYRDGRHYASEIELDG